MATSLLFLLIILGMKVIMDLQKDREWASKTLMLGPNLLPQKFLAHILALTGSPPCTHTLNQETKILAKENCLKWSHPVILLYLPLFLKCIWKLLKHLPLSLLTLEQALPPRRLLILTNSFSILLQGPTVIKLSPFRRNTKGFLTPLLKIKMKTMSLLMK
jgi:hypothetical protein